MFKANTYILRRQELRSELGSGLVLLPGNDESPINYTDNPYWYRQDSTFLYYFGIQKPGLVGIIDVDENRDYLFGDNPTIDEIIWGGNQIPIEELGSETGINNTGSINDLEKLLEGASSKGQMIHYLNPYRSENRIKIANWLKISSGQIEKRQSIKLIQAIVGQREIKSEEELIEIEKAVNTTVEMHIAAMQMVRPGLREQDIVAEVERIAKQAGGNTSFPTIATVHGEIMHNHYYGNVLKDGDMFLLDCGAETEMGYAGDLSSTIPIGRSFTEIQKEIYNISLESHNSAIEMLKPGQPFTEIHLEACRIITNGLKDLGIMRGDTQSALELGAHALFFPCGLGHQMGLDVHDMENLGEEYVGYDGSPKSTQFGLKSLRLGKPLKPGMVLTIEPGIYFIPALIKIWRSDDRFKDFINFEKLDEYMSFGGIRNEEDFLITETGYKLIGKRKPKTIDEVESQKL